MNRITLLLASMLSVVLLFAGISITSANKGDTVPPTDCIFRLTAGDKNIAVDWFESDSAPVTDAWIDPAIVKTRVVGRQRCGVGGARVIEWVWEADALQPTFVWYKVPGK